MTRERNSVGERRKNARRCAVVMPPRPRSEARVLRMVVLRVEKREMRVETLAVLLKELFHRLVVVVAIAPMCADHRDAVDVLHPDGNVLLPEAFLPRLLHVLVGMPYRVCDHGRVLLLLLVETPRPAPPVVVAVNEQLLDLAAVGRLAVGEDLEPRIAGALELADAPGVRDVARDEHAVRAVVTEVFERLDEVELVARILEMHVAQHTDLCYRLRGKRTLERRASRRHTGREAGTYEKPS